VYNPLPKTLDDLKVNLEREIKKINKDMLKSTFSNFEKRCHLLKLNILLEVNKRQNKFLLLHSKFSYSKFSYSKFSYSKFGSASHSI